MKDIALAATLVLKLAAAAHATNTMPPVLHHAVQCLAAKGFLLPSGSATLTFGYHLDAKSYAGEKVIYVVQYAGPARTDGLVFAVFLTERDGQRESDVQNNAGFSLSGDEPGGVTFDSPPLGGTWTQQHLVSAIGAIEKSPRFALAASGLSTTASNCAAYTDPQPGKN